jgi:hypothetical protein
MDFDRVMEVLRALHEERVDYVVVGGMALNLHGIHRNTEDIDLFVKTNPGNVDRLKRALHRVFHDPSIEENTAEDLGGDYATIRYVPPEGTLYLDLLGKSGELAGYDDLQVEEMDVEGVTVRVATAKTLCWLKRDSLRPIDRADVMALMDKLEVIEPGEQERK